MCVWLDGAKDESCIVSGLVFRGWFGCESGLREQRLLEKSARKHPRWQIRPLGVHVSARWKGTSDDNDHHYAVVLREPGVVEGSSRILRLCGPRCHVCLDPYNDLIGAGARSCWSRVRSYLPSASGFGQQLETTSYNMFKDCFQGSDLVKAGLMRTQLGGG